jgi:hypothetical protein
MTVSTNEQTLSNGLHVYTAGVALQELFIFCFVFLVFSFQRRLAREATVEQKVGAKKLLLILYVSLSLISVSYLFVYTVYGLLIQTKFRILFRIIEFSAGAGTKLTAEFRHHEVYQYVFDALPMLLALLTMNIFHPGMVLAEEDSRFAKVSKAEKKALKEQRKQEKQARKGGVEMSTREVSSDGGVQQV